MASFRQVHLLFEHAVKFVGFYELFRDDHIPVLFFLLRVLAVPVLNFLMHVLLDLPNLAVVIMAGTGLLQLTPSGCAEQLGFLHHISIVSRVHKNIYVVMQIQE